MNAGHDLPLLPAAWLRRGALTLAVAALVLVGLAQYTDLDLALADRGFDATLRHFAWEHAWFAEVVMHRWLKLPLVALGSALLLAGLVDLLRPWPRLGTAARWQLRSSAALALLVPLTIALAKRLSATHCPWSLARYGGHEAYLRLLDALPAGAAPGGCFPAGHASSVLWLAGLCVWWLPRRPRTAAAVFAAGLAAGFAVGWVQQLRGAHFLSHTLASLWVTAALVWALLAGLAWLQAAGSRAWLAPKTTRA